MSSINSNVRSAAEYLLQWKSELEMDNHVKDFLENLSRSIVPNNNPLVEVSILIEDDTYGDLEIEEVITLRDYLAKIYGAEFEGIRIERSCGPGVNTDFDDWTAEWCLNSYSRESGYYWSLDNCFTDFDFVKDIDRYLAVRGPFDPEKDSIPTVQDIKEFVKKK